MNKTKYISEIYIIKNLLETNHIKEEHEIDMSSLKDVNISNLLNVLEESVHKCNQKKDKKERLECELEKGTHSLLMLNDVFKKKCGEKPDCLNKIQKEISKTEYYIKDRKEKLKGLK